MYHVVSSAANMATFDDYLREGHLSAEQYDSLPLGAKGAERGRYLEWLKLKNPQPQLALVPVQSRWRMFMENLRQGGIASPEKAVVRQLQLFYAQNIDAVADSIEASLGLYRKVKELPSSSTLLHLEEQLELHIKGPASLSSANILTASDANRGMFTLKILRPFSDGLTSGYRTQREEILREALAVGELELSHPSVALVTIELLTVRDAESGREYNVLKMPRYLCTLGDNSKPRCWPRELVEEGMRMREAVQFMHQRGVVHMDIKASNIFISAADGRWYLGDFGSSKRVGEVITSSNLHAHSNVAIVGQKAHPKYDWLMLLLVLLRESLPRKVSWMTAFCNEHDKLDAGRIISFIDSLDEAGFVGLADVISPDRCEDLLTIYKIVE